MGHQNAGRADLHPSMGRFGAFGAVALVLFAALALRLLQVQVIASGRDAERTVTERTVEIPIPAPRGLIFDRDGRPLAINVPAWRVSVRSTDLPESERDRVLAAVAEIAGVGAWELHAALAAQPQSPADPIPILSVVEQNVALALAELVDDLPGIVIEARPIRRYLDETGAPGGELLAQVLGYTGPIGPESLERLTNRGYLHDDVIGLAGIEASFEEELRGTYGARRAERDASGRVGSVLDTPREPVAGRNLMLTIDAQTQRMATQALSWGMEVGGVTQGVTVVMNPQTGEILAMVSLPTYDNNSFASGISLADFQMYLADPTGPLRNHAISDIYPPGSTFKLVTAVAALEERVTTAEREWPTYACFQVPGAADGECLHDWNREGFGPLDMVAAFAHSSDTYFYQMAIELGVDPLARWAHALGFGERSGIALPGEAAGMVTSSAWARGEGRAGVYTGELAQAGIGQGAIAVTPLQVLNAYAALANGGTLMRPMVVRGETDAEGVLTSTRSPEAVRTVGASSEALQTMRIASREVIVSGHAYNIRDLQLPGALSGKTGTAEFGERADDGSLPFHSWFVAYLPSAPGAADAELAIVSFAYSAVVPGNVSAEVVKYFLQLHYGLDQDLRLDPNDFSLVTAN